MRPLSFQENGLFKALILTLKLYTLNYVRLDESSFPVKKRKVFTVLKSDDSDKNGEPQFWKEGVFSTMSENSLNNYKRYWNTFCTLSCIGKSNF